MLAKCSQNKVEKKVKKCDGHNGNGVKFGERSFVGKWVLNIYFSMLWQIMGVNDFEWLSFNGYVTRESKPSFWLKMAYSKKYVWALDREKLMDPI